jgi:methylated-DNA-[protein]-cysteine S-methyltransferase
MGERAGRKIRVAPPHQTTKVCAMLQTTIDTPTGPIHVTEEDGAITRLTWGIGRSDHSELLDEATRQLTAYFDGSLTAFDLPLEIKSSPFQRRICDAMLAIPFGDTVEYGDIARQLGAPPQAVGQGCGGNPIPIIVPCHRVLSASGLGGFSGGTGVETKVWLLRHEGAAGLLI